MREYRSTGVISIKIRRFSISTSGFEMVSIVKIKKVKSLPTLGIEGEIPQFFFVSFRTKKSEELERKARPADLQEKLAGNALKILEEFVAYSEPAME